MGLFGARAYQIMDEYGLSDLSSKDKESVRAIIEHLSKTAGMELDANLSLTGRPEDRIQIAYLQSIYEQNWIMIRELDRIAKALEK